MASPNPPVITGAGSVPSERAVTVCESVCVHGAHGALSEGVQAFPSWRWRLYTRRAGRQAGGRARGASLQAGSRQPVSLFKLGLWCVRRGCLHSVLTLGGGDQYPPSLSGRAVCVCVPAHSTSKLPAPSLPHSLLPCLSLSPVPLWVSPRP